MKQIITIILFFLAFHSLIAQNRSLFWSIQAGSGVSTYQTNKPFPDAAKRITTKLRPSFHFGGMITFPIKNSWAIRTGLSYNQLNAGESQVLDIALEDPTTQELLWFELSDDYIYRFQYLAVPLVAELQSQRAVFHLGVQYMRLFEVSRDYRSESITPGTYEISVFNLSNEPRYIFNNDLGIKAGYAFKIKPYLSIDIQGYIAISGIINQDEVGYYYDRKLRQLTLGLTYNYL